MIIRRPTSSNGGKTSPSSAGNGKLAGRVRRLCVGLASPGGSGVRRGLAWYRCGRKSKFPRDIPILICLTPHNSADPPPGFRASPPDPTKGGSVSMSKSDAHEPPCTAALRTSMPMNRPVAALYERRSQRNAHEPPSLGTLRTSTPLRTPTADAPPLS